MLSETQIGLIFHLNCLLMKCRVLYSLKRVNLSHTYEDLLLNKFSFLNVFLVDLLDAQDQMFRAYK